MELFMPAGQLRHLPLVTAVTAAVYALGTAALLYAIHQFQ